MHYAHGDNNDFQDYQKFDLPSFTSSTKVLSAINLCVYIKLIDLQFLLIGQILQTNFLHISLSPSHQGDHRGAHQGHPQGVSQLDDDDGDN